MLSSEFKSVLLSSKTRKTTSHAFGNCYYQQSSKRASIIYFDTYLFNKNISVNVTNVFYVSFVFVLNNSIVSINELLKVRLLLFQNDRVKKNVHRCEKY